MAWSWKQSVSATDGAASVAATFTTANLTSGSKMIAAISVSGGVTVSTVKDGGGNSFAEMKSNTTASNFELSIWELDTPAGDAGTKPTITATFSSAASGGAAILVQEVTGLATGTTTAACLDGTPGITGGTNSTNFSTGTPTYVSTALNEYLVAVYGDNGDTSGCTWTAPGGYTADTNGVNTNSAADLTISYKNSTNGTESDGYSVTTSASANWDLTLVAFQLPAGGAVAAAPILVVDPAELILAQYGLDSVFQHQTPNAGAPMVSWAGTGNLDFEASATFTETAYSVPPQVLPAELILAQCGFDSVYFATPRAGAPMTQWSGSGNLDFEASATFTETAYSVPPQVLPAELVLREYGLDSVYFTTPNAGAPMASWAGTGNLDFEASATFTAGVPSVVLPILPAELILRQYGLDTVFLVTPNAGGVTIVNWTGSGNLDFEASATFTETAYSVPPQVLPAELILNQYGADSAYLATPNAGAPMASWRGTGNLDFEASATFTETAYSVPPQVTPAELILQQYGLDAALLLTPNAGAPMVQWSGLGNLDFEASAPFTQTAYSVPPQIQVAQLLLQQYGLDATLLITPNAGVPMAQVVGAGNVDFEASATFTIPTIVGPIVVPAELILTQYGLDAAFQIQAPPLPSGVPSGLPAKVAPGMRSASVSPSSKVAVVDPEIEIPGGWDRTTWDEDEGGWQ